MKRFVILLLAMTVLAACAEEPPAVVEAPRPIKGYVISEVASAQIRRYSGVLEAADTATLSFQVPGNVAEIAVSAGDRVSEGDLIARLDASAYQLDVQAAEAELQRAQADFRAKEADAARQRSLFEKEWISKAALDQTEAAYSAARSNVDYARSRLGIVRRNLENTEIRAPFDGVIAARNVDEFQDVQAGQPLFEINGDGALQARFAVPETAIGAATLGLPVEVRVASADVTLTGRIAEVSAVATDANAYGVKAALFDAPDELRSGMTAAIALQVRGPEDASSGYLVPLAAIAPAEGSQRGYVFKYDENAGVVRKTFVAGSGVRENMVVVTEGVEPGDIIAAAGVSFLLDGQEVRLLDGAEG